MRQTGLTLTVFALGIITAVVMMQSSAQETEAAAGAYQVVSVVSDGDSITWVVLDTETGTSNLLFASGLGGQVAVYHFENEYPVNNSALDNLLKNSATKGLTAEEAIEAQKAQQ